MAKTSSSSRTWTDEQEQGISIVGHSLLVSAAAGSGKTAVLAERCARLVCNPDSRCDVDELLVVTFTRPAAAEMRTRIEAAIRQRLEVADPALHARLARQVASLDRASIGTLHSFCTQVLREHFHLIGLDPGFTLIDDDQAKLLRLETARALFAERYDDQDARAFQAFIDQYADGDDQRLIRRVIDTHELLCSVVKPDEWQAKAIDRIARASTGKLGNSELGKALAADVHDRLNDLQTRCIAAATAFNEVEELEPYAEHVNELLATVQWWNDCFANSSFDRLADAVRAFDMPRLPAVPKEVPGKDAGQETINAIKKEMKPDGGLGSLCRFSESEWKEGLDRTIEPTRMFLSLVTEFTTRFDQAKRKMRSLDYSDLERSTLKVLSDGNGPSIAARRYHKRFKHVLVDEYQDINEVQDRILSLVSRESLPAKEAAGGNLFAVGDVKQSIYRFRLAQPRQFQNRADRFRENKNKADGQVVDLRTNFRSRAKLLATLNGLFERLMTRTEMEIAYDESHQLRAPEISDFDCLPCDEPAVVLHLLPPPGAVPAETEESLDQDRSDREGALIAAEIHKLINSKTLVLDKTADKAATRPVRFGDIAILLRSMQFKADQFAQALRAAGIPVHSDSSTGFFDSTEIRDLLSLLAILDNQQQDIPLAAVLRSPLLQLQHSEDALASARLIFPDIPFHAAVKQFAIDSTDPLAAELRSALATLDRWREWTGKQPLSQAIWSILIDSGYLAFCSGLADGEQGVANLLSFHERARQFDSSGQSQGLSRFRLFLDSLRDESDLGQPSIAIEGDNAVRIMSIHRSKGLEFPIVFVPDLGKKHNFQSCAGTILVDRSAYVGLSVVDEERRVRYPSLAHAMASESMRRQTLAEELRVLYVAATRACERLILVGTCKTDAVTEWTTRFGNHVGPLPPGQLLGGQTPLDWIGPASAALTIESPGSMTIIVHDENDLQTQLRPPKTQRSALQETLADLKRLNPAPAINERAKQVLDRLDRSYPFAAFTDVPAAKSVSRLAADSHGPFPIKLALPQDATPDRELAATEIGDATHIVLEHLDHQHAGTRAELQSQIQKMVDRRFLTQKAADSVDLTGIEWFIASDLGKMMRTNAADVLREWPISFPHKSGEVQSNDPLDQTMIRGRIDVLIPMPDKCVLIDYKTDRISDDSIDRQVEHHRDQIQLYATAIESLLNRPVKGYLAFLTARQWRAL